ncbi:coiled-coil domain-containing protein 42-like protein [Plakobranchus ocellatus]|uniref:Coiled-coil domain-containing protein 42-like protein n=1 Tax=Plakobranchus ocellatus TaxID=259542 RepID=A0AAV4DXI5_9GAST|nr:coiled-coil domain-containing protein 42-like protein [Plakobranchus ocellatus]
MATHAPYQLDLDNQKRNVFVTQLHDRDDEEDITAFPVVKESGDKLIETGINTLQKTLLLKKEVEVDKVNAQLEAKRYEFKQRMETCSHRQIQVQKKQQQMKDRVSKFEKFIQENEAKRRRAIQKYQQEVKLREQKAIEFSSLHDQLQHYKNRLRKLEAKAKAYKIYEEYLQGVIDAMPEDYLPTSEDKVKGLMMRHRTLSESNKGLVANLDDISDELECCRKELELLTEEHQKHHLSDTSQLSQLQGKKEEVKDCNEQMEQNFQMNKGEMRKKRTETGIIFMAIDNIYDKCKKSTDPVLGKADWDTKLNRIRDYLHEREGVVNFVNDTSSSASGSASFDGMRGRSYSKSNLKVTGR